jgi:transposase-like protein
MAKYLIQLNDNATEEMTLFQLDADTLDDAREKAKESYPNSEIVSVKHTHGGKRNGAGRVSKWGEGVKTQVYRLPSSIGEKVEDVITELEMVNHILDSWQSKVDESKGKSANGQPSERYKYVAQLVADLKQAMSVSSKKLV